MRVNYFNQCYRQCWQSLLLALCINSCFVYNAYADSTDDLVAALSQLNNLSGQFEQSLVDDQGTLLQESSGTFLLKRPGYFRWETMEPFPQLLVSDLQSIWLYDPDLEQVTIRSYDQKLSQTPALLLNGDAEQIRRQYTVDKLSDDEYRLTPIEQQDLFNILDVVFVEGQLSRMSLVDSLGQTTTFHLINTATDQDIQLSDFTFEPPEGTDIIVGE